jgi:hypothetical protein
MKIAALNDNIKNRSLDPLSLEIPELIAVFFYFTATAIFESAVP